MGNRIEHVIKYALDVCNAKDTGGRVCAQTHDSGTISDCAYWPDVYSQAIMARFPDSTLSFLSAPDTSSSGFVIIISIVNTNPLSYVKPSDVFMMVVTGMMAMHTAYLFAKH